MSQLTIIGQFHKYRSNTIDNIGISRLEKPNELWDGTDNRIMKVGCGTDELYSDNTDPSLTILSQLYQHRDSSRLNSWMWIFDNLDKLWNNGNGDMKSG